MRSPWGSTSTLTRPTRVWWRWTASQTTCCELLSTPDGDVVFTDMDRLDGVTGSVDLLVVYDSAEAGG